MRNSTIRFSTFPRDRLVSTPWVTKTEIHGDEAARLVCLQCFCKPPSTFLSRPSPYSPPSIRWIYNDPSLSCAVASTTRRLTRRSSLSLPDQSIEMNLSNIPDS